MFFIWIYIFVFSFQIDLAVQANAQYQAYTDYISKSSTPFKGSSPHPFLLSIDCQIVAAAFESMFIPLNTSMLETPVLIHSLLLHSYCKPAVVTSALRRRYHRDQLPSVVHRVLQRGLAGTPAVLAVWNFLPVLQDLVSPLQESEGVD